MRVHPSVCLHLNKQSEINELVSCVGDILPTCSEPHHDCDLLQTRFCFTSLPFDLPTNSISLPALTVTRAQ